MNPLLAAGWQPLIPFILAIGFFCLSLLHAAWKKANQRNLGGNHDPLFRGMPMDDSWPQEHPVRRPHGNRPSPEFPDAGPPVLNPVRPPSPWELDLERILNGEPPLRVVRSSRPPEPAFPTPAPTPGSSLPPLLAAIPVSESTDLESAPAPSDRLAWMTTASRPYDRAATLQDRARAHTLLARSPVNPAAPTRASVRPATLDPGVATLVRNLGKSATARQAIVSSIVLAPPKAFE